MRVFPLRTAFLAAFTCVGIVSSNSARAADTCTPESGRSHQPPLAPAQIAEVRAALAGASTLQTRLLNGEDAEPPYDEIARFALLEKQARTPRLRQLFHRVAQDQIFRMHFVAMPMKFGWAKNLDGGAAAAVSTTLMAEGCRIDRSNLAWIKADIARNGWPTISASGADADFAAWLLVQHADDDPFFQGQMLIILNKLVATGGTNGRNYAYLYDRVARKIDAPQAFGTQGRCISKGQWNAYPVRDPVNIDRKRQSVGLGPIRAYEIKMSASCEEALPDLAPEEIAPDVRKRLAEILKG